MNRQYIQQPTHSFINHPSTHPPTTHVATNPLFVAHSPSPHPLTIRSLSPRAYIDTSTHHPSSHSLTAHPSLLMLKHSASSLWVDDHANQRRRKNNLQKVSWDLHKRPQHFSPLATSFSMKSLVCWKFCEYLWLFHFKMGLLWWFHLLKSWFSSLICG